MNIDLLIKISNFLDKKHKYCHADILDNLIIRLSHNLGEWWLKPNGEAEFADGDVGDYNHDMLAAQHIFNEMNFDIPNPYASYNADDTYNDGPFSQSDANTYFWDTYAGENGEVPKKMLDYKEEISKLHGADIDEVDLDLVHYLAWKATRNIVNPQDRKIVFNNTFIKYKHMWDGLNRAREYAMEHFGWHRLAGNNIETWKLTPEILSNMVNGLYEAFGKDVETMTFNIDIKSPPMYLAKIPFNEISSGLILNKLKESRVEDVAPGFKRQTPNVPKIPSYKYEGG
jgi:hypothetical protein